jgi:hypothetical protein
VAASITDDESTDSHATALLLGRMLDRELVSPKLVTAQKLYSPIAQA